MTPSELREYCYSEEDMAAILGGSDGPLAPSTMRGKIHRRTSPPYIRVGSDYWFPRDLFADWLRSIRPTLTRRTKRDAS